MSWHVLTQANYWQHLQYELTLSVFWNRPLQTSWPGLFLANLMLLRLSMYAEANLCSGLHGRDQDVMVVLDLSGTMASGALGKSDICGPSSRNLSRESKDVLRRRWEGVNFIRMADEITAINSKLGSSVKDEKQQADLLNRQAELLEKMWKHLDSAHQEQLNPNSLDRGECGLANFEPKAIDVMKCWGINPNELTTQKVEERWRILVQKVHPDLNPGIHEIEFVRLRRAKTYLLQLCLTR